MHVWARVCVCVCASSRSWTVVGQRFHEGFQAAAEEFAVQAVRRDARRVLDDVLHVQLEEKQRVRPSLGRSPAQGRAGGLTLLYMCWSVSRALDTDRSVFSTNFSPLGVS